MKTGDLVGEITNPWVLNNPGVHNTEMKRDLFGYTQPKILGIVVGFSGKVAFENQKTVHVLTDNGTIRKIRKFYLEVINEKVE